MEHPSRPLVETPDMRIILSDGCRFSARVWMPDDAPFTCARDP
ncbi:MAG: hypothetical protein ACU0BH_02715 [Paracoccaceae bacterium]